MVADKRQVLGRVGSELFCVRCCLVEDQLSLSLLLCCECGGERRRES